MNITPLDRNRTAKSLGIGILILAYNKPQLPKTSKNIIGLGLERNATASTRPELISDGKRASQEMDKNKTRHG